VEQFGVAIGVKPGSLIKASMTLLPLPPPSLFAYNN
jgi:hypothetical protein